MLASDATPELIGQVSQWIGTYAQVLVAVGTLALAIAAWVGLTTWRKKIQGERTHDLAWRLLVACRKVRDRIIALRRPALFPRMEEPGDDEEVSEGSLKFIEDSYSERLDQLLESQRDLRPLILEADAVWTGSSSLTQNYDRLSELITSLKSSVSFHIAMLKNPNERRVDVVSERWESAKRDLWAGGEDPLGEELDEALIAIEEEVKQRKTSPHGSGYRGG